MSLVTFSNAQTSKDSMLNGDRLHQQPSMWAFVCVCRRCDLLHSVCHWTAHMLRLHQIWNEDIFQTRVAIWLDPQQHLARNQICPSLLFYFVRLVFHLRWDPCVARNKSHMTICYVNMWMEQNISESRLLSFGLSVASADWGVWNRKPMLEKEKQSI